MQNHNDAIATWGPSFPASFMGKEVSYMSNIVGSHEMKAKIGGFQVLKCGCIGINCEPDKDAWIDFLLVQRSQTCKNDRSTCARANEPVWDLFVIDELPTEIETMIRDSLLS